MEKTLLLSHQSTWEGLKGTEKQRDGEGNLINAKDELVDDMIQELFEVFPERDLTRNPASALAFAQPDRDKLHTVC